MSKNTREQLTIGTVATHWLLAFAMIGLIVLGMIVGDMIEAAPVGPNGKTLAPEQLQMIGLHKSLGVAVLLLALFRVFQRIINPFPTYVGNYSTIEVVLSKLTMLVLVLGTILMPISGIVMSVGAGKPVPLFGLMLYGGGEKNEMLQQMGATMHGLGGKLLIAFIVLHVLGALKHRIIDGDGTMHRIAGLKVKVADSDVA